MSTLGVLGMASTAGAAMAPQRPTTAAPSVQSILLDTANAKANDTEAETELAYALGLQGYVLGTPYVHFDTWRAGLVQRLSAFGLTPKINSFVHQPILASPKISIGGEAANVDTLYSMALLDLSHGQVVLDVGAITDRYYSIQIASASLTNVALLSRRTRGDKPGKYLLVGPDFHGETPAGETLIRMPTNEGLILARVFAATQDDLGAARVAQHQLMLEQTPGEATTVSPVLAAAPGSGALAFFEKSGALMRRNPPPPPEAAVLRGLAPAGLPFSPGAAERLDSPTRAGLERALVVGPKVVARAIHRLGVKVGSWVVTYEGGEYGQDYLGRAAGAVGGLLLLDPKEALYFRQYADSRGEPLDGARSYTLHVKAKSLDGCKGFWSLTTYDADSRLIENGFSHYAVNDRQPELKRDADGGLTLALSRSPAPGQESNWLPASPQGYFTVILRCYEPDASFFDRAALEQRLPTIDRVPE